MKLRARGKPRRSAAIDRRFTIGRFAANGWRALRRPKNLAFWVAAGFVLFTAAPVVRYFKEHRYFAVRGVDVRGTERLAETRVRSWLGMEEGRSIWQAVPKDLEEALRRHPPIADAQVRRVLPDRLEVTIEEREPDVVVRDERGFFLADVDGVLFERAGPDHAALSALPIVTVARAFDPAAPRAAAPQDGASAREETLGDASQLPTPMLAEAIALAARLEGGHGGIGVSEVTIEPGPADGSGPDLVVYGADGQLAVRLGWGDWDEKLGALARVVAHARSAGRATAQGLSGHVDVRDPEAVVARWAGEGAA